MMATNIPSLDVAKARARGSSPEGSSVQSALQHGYKGKKAPTISPTSVPAQHRNWQQGFPECVPLLKFDPGSPDKPHLIESGLFTLASLPPPVSIVTLLGDGRCGKSTLASRLIDDERHVFPVGATGAAVTEGIDMCIIPRGGGASEGSLVVLDCEGGNNPTGAIRGAVDLVAMFASTLTVQVVWGQMSEGQLLQIGQGIAVRDRLLSGNPTNQRFQGQRLLLVVNGCHLHYDQDQLDKTFLEVHTGTSSARNELRQNIKRTFEQIQFLTVPPEKDFSYLTHLETFRNAVSEHCFPAALSGVRLSGAQVAEMLKSAVVEFRTAGSVPVLSVFRHVIFDHLLKPLVTDLMESFKAALPDLSDGEFRPTMPDARLEILEAFDNETQQLTHRELVAEAREDMRKRADVAWQRVLDQNEAIGEQDRDVATESETRYSHTEERVVAWKRSCGVLGKKTPQVEACSVFRVWTRTRVLKKNGQVAYSEWRPSNHNVEGPSLNGSSSMRSSGGWSSTTNASVNGGVVGVRDCTSASPLMVESGPGSPRGSRPPSMISPRGGSVMSPRGTATTPRGASMISPRGGSLVSPRGGSLASQR